MNWRKIALKIHLWLGLALSFVILIVAATGCIYAFEKEIQDLTQPYRFVTPKNKEMLSPTQLKKIGTRILPKLKIHSVQYPEKGRSSILTFFQSGQDAYYWLVFVNPYDGQVLRVKNMEEDFFRFILNGHFYLWLPPPIGQPLVSWSCLLLLMVLFTGFLIWFPNNKRRFLQKWSINWSDSWRRKNYLIHQFLGIYSSGFFLIFIITGMVWGIEWFTSGYYKVLSFGKTYRPYYESYSARKTSMEIGVQDPVDILWRRFWPQKLESSALEIHYPEMDSSTIALSLNPDPTVYWRTDFRYFEQQTLNEIEVDHVFGRFRKDSTPGEKLFRMNYDVHTGAIGGIAGKAIAFLASLAILLLPITGFLIWFGRRYKPSTGKNRKIN